MKAKAAYYRAKSDRQSGRAEVGVAAFMIIATLIPLAVLIFFSI